MMKKLLAILLAVCLCFALCACGSYSSSSSNSDSQTSRCNNCGGSGWDSANNCSCVWCGGDGETVWNP